MLTELWMELETENKEFGYYQSSNMQGILMEQINSTYAEKLHEQGLNPYSQHIEIGERKVWCVKTLNEEAYENIIHPLLNPHFKEFAIEKKNIEVKIRKKEVRTRDKKELLDKFYGGETERFLNLEFVTPTAFKSNGNYVIMPELRYIYQSFMNKYSAASEAMDMFDEESLDQLVQNSRIVQYKLRSTSFPLEGVRIPSFKGEVGIKLNGTETMARYARFLAEFGEYSGVGIKTAMGMGAVRIIEREKKYDR